MKRKIYREDILDAGLDLMFTNGYNATGIKEITEKVSIPKGSFYNHFSNKEEFGLEVVKRYCDGGSKMYERTFLNSDLPPLKRIEQFFDQLIHEYTNQLEFKLGCVMSNFSAELSDTNEAFRSLLDDEFQKQENIIAHCLQEAKSNGDILDKLDVKQIAAIIINGWHGALIRMKTTGNSKPLLDCKDMVINYLLK